MTSGIVVTLPTLSSLADELDVDPGLLVLLVEHAPSGVVFDLGWTDTEIRTPFGVFADIVLTVEGERWLRHQVHWGSARVKTAAS